MTAKPPLVVRAAVAADAAGIVALIRQLAAFERSGMVPALTEDAVLRDCFGPQPRFSVLLAEGEGRVRGGVVLLDAYSSWAGKPAMFVHDLYVEDGARGRGIGRELLAAAARLAVERDCCRLDVNVLSWNRSARAFYEGLGFVALEQWHPYRLEADGLRRLAGAASGRGS